MADLVFDLIGIPSDKLGWIPREELPFEQREIHDNTINATPELKIIGSTVYDSRKVCLWDFAKKVNNGQHLPTLRQQSGSCVGQGLANAIMYLQAYEIVRLRDPEQYIMPFILYGYGRSRYYAGFRGQGEGSTGAGAALASKKDGVLPSNFPGVPQPLRTQDGSITYGLDMELKWSAGERIEPKYIEAGRKHLIKSTALVRSVDQCRESIVNGYPVTIASSWGGLDRPPVVKGVLLNHRVTRWNHQMCVIAWWDYPELGELFYIINSWGPAYHGNDPAGGPPGGFWVRAAEMTFILQQNDSFAFSQFDGFPAQRLNFNLID